MKLRVATRGSKLSIAQTMIALEAIKRVEPSLEYELVIVKTRGDIHQDKPFTAIGGKGLFEKEVNLAVLEGRADIAVHSLKDVPSAISPGLVLAMTPPRDPPYDVLVVRGGKEKTIWDLPSGAIVGTSSARRVAMLKHVRRDLVFKVLRGNVDTRLRKLEQGQYDAIVLAEAGLKRLGVDIEYWRIPPDILPPAPGQGIIGVYTLSSRSDILPILEKASDQKAMAEARAERAFLAYAGGGCHTPLGAYAELRGNTLYFHAALASPDGSRRVEVRVEGDPDKPTQVGLEAAFELRRLAAREGISL
ncbi:hydroxymethylbilane synthase [Hyperthermus butylicus]|uniref:Probable porphobilinogen deaminase n=1 Tax=Hyperthermus butylicus (strain DSM 5456 / JCM 9403 / PLM1-5) TaxID=415426 RepID=HEM3_HYPBU|nr:hydroxymethylbilane synthase [Hyperthermus butylicus]A2BL26.1 RecName: Full=Probable porphobilinogen deaminase; Short=PBG; AltName: Full=Hydroxymethylbilane synthase; Short=HMBS; AltName: Full=Pre-uroporphyrinogen synthase [Hyperthermus butylicus DSM 5456]ABM80687.1 Porphobilinogen deaminase [Hyperthermus butylicus DSM 5456]